MVPDPDTACVGLEYFGFKGDELWNMDDDDLVALATRELEQLGLASPAQVRRGYVVRVPMAYPMYDEDYAERVATIRTWLDPLGSTSSRSAATGCTATTTPTTRCSARCAPSTTSSTTPATTSGRSTSSASYHEEQTDADNDNPYKKLPEPVAAEAAA